MALVYLFTCIYLHKDVFRCILIDQFVCGAICLYFADQPFVQVLSYRFVCPFKFSNHLTMHERLALRLFFFTLNSAEHKFILLINFKMATCAGIFTFINRINATLDCFKEEKIFDF